jgi:hypothetical protein
MKIFKTEKYEILIIGFCVVIGLITNIIFSFDGLYGQDGFGYLNYAEQLNLYISQGVQPEPFSWPIYYPLISALFSQIFGHLSQIMQFVSLISWGITGIFIYKLILLDFKAKKQTFFYVLWFFILSPYVFRLGQLVMSDMMAIMFILGSFYYGIIYGRQKKIKHLYLTTIMAVAAIMTRIPAVVVLLPLAVFMVIKMYQKPLHLFQLIGIVLVVIFMIFPYLLLNSGQANEILNHNAITLWDANNFILNNFESGDNNAEYASPNIIYAFSHFYHPRYAFSGIFMLAMLVWKKAWKKEWLVLYISILLYSLFLAGIQSQNSRFLLLTFPLVVISLYPGYRAFSKLSFFINYRRIIYTGLILIQCFLCYLSMKPIFSRIKLEKQIVKMMEPFQNETLYSFDMDISLAGRGMEFDYKNLWGEKYDRFEIEGLVLFNIKAFSDLWEGKAPMDNWKKIVNTYKIDTLIQGPEGWNLYRVKDEIVH